jgi:hypothetical protein
VTPQEKLKEIKSNLENDTYSQDGESPEPALKWLIARVEQLEKALKDHCVRRLGCEYCKAIETGPKPE